MTPPYHCLPFILFHEGALVLFPDIYECPTPRLMGGIPSSPMSLSLVQLQGSAATSRPGHSGCGIQKLLQAIAGPGMAPRHCQHCSQAWSGSQIQPPQWSSPELLLDSAWAQSSSWTQLRSNDGSLNSIWSIVMGATATNRIHDLHVVPARQQLYLADCVPVALCQYCMALNSSQILCRIGPTNKLGEIYA